MVNLKMFQVQMKSLVVYSGNGMNAMLYLLVRAKMSNIREQRGSLYTASKGNPGSHYQSSGFP